MVRRLLAERATTAEDLEAQNRLSWFLRFLKQAEKSVPAEHRERAEKDFLALEHCYRLLEEMLVAGLAPLEEGL